jgi:hypothetical protein
VQKEKFMNKAKNIDPLDKKFTLDALEASGQGVRGKYLTRVRKGSNVVKLKPEIAKVFNSESAVNAALSLVIKQTKLINNRGIR